MFHMQNSVPDWPRAVAMLPAGSLVKVIDRGDILRDVKAINPGVITALRHYGGPQNIFDGRGFEAYKILARQFLATFIDATFLKDYAQFTDIVIEWNEYLASSHTGAELQDRLNWAEAIAWVWKHEYQPLPQINRNGKPIRLGLLSCPVGNDIHRGFAEIAIQYDCVLSYHAYDKHINGVRDPLSWRYHSGRWAFMEQSWGLKPDWMFGEAGPYAGVLEGWKHSLVLGGNRDAYVAAVKKWIGEIKTTPAYAEGRVLGFALFTTGGTNEWKWYETQQPELDQLAAMIKQEWKPVAPPPPPPPPDPEPEPRKYPKKGHIVPPTIARRLFDAVVDEAWAKKESVFFSIDDALQPAANSNLVQVTARDVDVWNVETVLNKPEAEAKQILEKFAGTYYPVPQTAFNYRRLGSLFTADKWQFPLGTAAERASGIIPPGGWFDATGFLTRYQLGNGFAVHTGNDWNLNVPTFDMDRNKPVYPMAAGKVTFAGIPTPGWSGVVVVRHQLPDGKFMYSRYGHLQPDELFVQKEDWVKLDDILGLTGRNMTSLGPGPFHLHLDLGITNVLLNDPGHWPGDNVAEVLKHYIDPAAWLKEHA